MYMERINTMTRNTALRLLAILITLFAIALIVREVPTGFTHVAGWALVSVVLQKIFVTLFGSTPEPSAYETKMKELF